MVIIFCTVATALIGDVRFDSRQNPAPAIGTNWSEAALYQFVLFCE